MRQKSETPKTTPEQVVKDIRRATRKHHSAEEKIRIVLEGLRGEYSIAELCRREGIAESLYYLVEGVPGGWETPAGRRYRTGRDQRRGDEPPPRGPGHEDPGR